MSLSTNLARHIFPIYLSIFQIIFIILIALFADYKFIKGEEHVPQYYAMWQDVHTMMFIGFGFLMTFLKKYGYGSIGFNMLIAAYVIEWSLLIRGFLSDDFKETSNVKRSFTIDVTNLLVADFCAAAVLISFGALLGKTSPTQLLIVATIEVVVQSINEHICLHYLHAYDIGESMYVHAFGAYFGIAVARVIHLNKIESEKESATVTTDLFAMIGTLFLWLYWPSFNSAMAIEEGQMRAIVNTVLSIASSCIATFVMSHLVGKGKLNMIHVQNATLAGGVAVGTVADMMIHPFGAMIIGSAAGILSTLGYQYVTPLLRNKLNIHDTCGVNNLHGMPGILSGLIGVLVAGVATREAYYGNDLYKYYPSRLPKKDSYDYFLNELHMDNSTLVFLNGGDGRSASVQAGYQAAALVLTLSIAIVAGTLTGFILKLSITQKIIEQELLFEDEMHWELPHEQQ